MSNPEETVEGNFRVLRWYNEQHRLHRDDDLPAEVYIVHNCNTIINSCDATVKEVWYQHGKKHRDGDKPALISNFDRVEEKIWYKDDIIHRDNNQPAYYLKDESLESSYIKEEWYINGKLGNVDDKPSKVFKQLDGKVYAAYWYKDDVLHRDGDKPAEIMFNCLGKLCKAYYYVEGKLHRVNGPAIEIFGHKNNIFIWYLNGVEYRANSKPTREEQDKYGNILS